jgi:hypothetical protein
MFLIASLSWGEATVLFRSGSLGIEIQACAFFEADSIFL